MTDNELLEIMLEDDIGGLALLVDTYSAAVYEVVADVLSGVASDKDIEDCVADSFMAFYNNIYDVDLSRGSIKAYLGVIAQRRAVNLCYTLNPDDERAFREYTVEEMNEASEKEEVPENPELSQRIKALCLKDMAHEGFATENLISEEFIPEEDTAEEAVYEESAYEEDTAEERVQEERDDRRPVVTAKKKNSSFFGRVLKTVVAAAALVTVVAAAVIALDRLGAQEQENITTTKVTTTQASRENPLLSAILAGNEKLIESLIANSLLLTQDILTFAIESADKISYDTIRSIAEQVRSKYGSTGLDPLLDEAIFGNFETVRDRLSEKDESEMTPAEKLAWFFVTSFGNSN